MNLVNNNLWITSCIIVFAFAVSYFNYKSNRYILFILFDYIYIYFIINYIFTTLYILDDEVDGIKSINRKSINYVK